MKYSLGCNEIHLQFLVYYNDYRFFHFVVYWPNVHFLLVDGDYKCETKQSNGCLLYTSDAADDMQCVDLGGRRIIKK